MTEALADDHYRGAVVEAGAAAITARFSAVSFDKLDEDVRRDARDEARAVLEAADYRGAVERAESAEAKVARLEAIIWKHRYAIGADVPSYMDGMTAT